MKKQPLNVAIIIAGVILVTVTALTDLSNDKFTAILVIMATVANPDRIEHAMASPTITEPLLPTTRQR